ncbi:MAG: thioredoxin [Candidatus Electrothrix sp. GW3-4]|uniref:thioredoxin n=1 Tax=Candidatus Electrothrix sp. GW3-4 TaxID=3126740 RepID=UPI0030D18C39
MASEQVLAVNDSDFETTVEKNELPCLVDFWAPWCGPCKAIGPVIDELAEEYAGKVQIVKMNVDESPATPGKFGIKAIPTLILFKNGEAIDRITGAVGKAQLKELISKAL